MPPSRPPKAVSGHLRVALLAALVLLSAFLRFKVTDSISQAEQAAPPVRFEPASFYQPAASEEKALTASVEKEEDVPEPFLRQSQRTRGGRSRRVSPLIRESNQPFQNLKSLPVFSEDHEFYVLGSTLTRDTRLGQLVIDIFFMGAKALTGGASFPGVQDASADWKRAKEVMKTDVRERPNGGYYCVMQLEEEGGGRYVSVGPRSIAAVIVPTATTVDGNVNDMLNILRCELPRGLQALVKQRRAGNLQVQVLERVGGSMQPVVNYSMPVSERTTGYIRYGGRGGWGAGTDVWKGGERDGLHMCIPGLRSELKSPMTEMIVEHLEYHLMQGVTHFWLGADYKWGSADMNRLEELLERYVSEGVVSISSTAVVEGGTLHSELKKTYFLNQCLYHTKALATWVGIWDFDELLVPRSPSRTIADVIAQHANADGRDVAFLLLTSYSHALDPARDRAGAKWIGERFADTREAWHDDAWQKCILSSKDVYYTGFHLPGAVTANEHDWTRLVRDDDPEWPIFAKRVDRAVAAMFHYRNVMTPNTYVRSPSLEKSEYAAYYFDLVLDRIRTRGMDQHLQNLGRAVERRRL